MARNKYPVLFNEEQLELRASQVGDIYHQMARDLFDEVIDRLLERGAESLADNPYIWHEPDAHAERAEPGHNRPLL